MTDAPDGTWTPVAKSDDQLRAEAMKIATEQATAAGQTKTTVELIADANAIYDYLKGSQ